VREVGDRLGGRADPLHLLPRVGREVREDVEELRVPLDHLERIVDLVVQRDRHG
jgi:hypothetical protein